NSELHFADKRIMSTNEDLFEKILKEHQELSSLPQTLAEVLRVSRDENASAKDLSSVLMRDPALTVKTLRLANSPFFGAGREITSMVQAVMVLGTKSVTALALSASIYDLSGKWKSSIDRHRFWRHSISVAISARNLAEMAGLRNSEEAFVVGLLHDIGMLVLEGSFPDKYARLWGPAEAGESIESLEENIWGTNHARVGQFLMEQWHIPESICDAVGSHHAGISLLKKNSLSPLSQVVALANLTAYFTVVKSRPRSVTNQEQTEILCENLKLQQAAIHKNSETLLRQTTEEAKFLEIDIGSTSDLLNEANQMLFSQYLTLDKLLHENRSMQREIAHARIEAAALETLKAITATFNHYVNNAIGTILGRAQLVQSEIQRGKLIDSDDKTMQSMDVIVRGVYTVRSVMNELLDLSSFDTTVYYDDTLIVDIEKKIEEQLASLEEPPAVAKQ
ncbi:MAG: HDOD domain-containing protein, partial [candidate division Zixibacteria bacterium]|nr:HDOD domain-containing protein [candidate division Zixibacteria bacterium]